MSIKLFHLILISLFLGSCARKNNPAVTETTSFTVLEAKKEHWTAGHARGGSGVDYYLSVVINTKDPIKFDSAWVNQKILPVFLATNRPSISDMPITFSIGDTITLRITDLINENKTNEIIEVPVKHEGELLFRFWLQNQAHFYSVNNIKTVDAPNRQ